MTHAPSIYLILLAGLNAALAWGGNLLAHALRLAYRDLLGTQSLPAITSYALRLPWSFLFLAVVALTLARVTWGRNSFSPWGHVCAALVGFEILLLAFVSLGLVLPFFTLTIKI